MKNKKEIIGVVVSDKTDKTITIEVEGFKISPIYKKRVKYKKKYAIHDEKNEAKIGDKVKCVETRPLSKTKRYKLVEVIEKSVLI